MTVQPGVREPQEQDPLLWAGPGAQVAAELPTPPGDATQGRYGDPCPEAPGDRYNGPFRSWVCGFAVEEADREVGLVSQSTSRVGLLPLPCPAIRSRCPERADEWEEMAMFSFLMGVSDTEGQT